MGTGPRKGHFYSKQFLEKIIFMVTSPRKGHFYGDQSQKRSFLWRLGPREGLIIIGQKKIINYFYGLVLFLWDRSWGTF